MLSLLVLLSLLVFTPIVSCSLACLSLIVEQFRATQFRVVSTLQYPPHFSVLFTSHNVSLCIVLFCRSVVFHGFSRSPWSFGSSDRGERTVSTPSVHQPRHCLHSLIEDHRAPRETLISYDPVSRIGGGVTSRVPTVLQSHAQL